MEKIWAQTKWESLTLIWHCGHPSWIFFKLPYLCHFKSDWCTQLNNNLVGMTELPSKLLKILLAAILNKHKYGTIQTFKIMRGLENCRWQSVYKKSMIMQWKSYKKEIMCSKETYFIFIGGSILLTIWIHLVAPTN